jgi:hypothetical protein
MSDPLPEEPSERDPVRDGRRDAELVGHLDEHVLHVAVPPLARELSRGHIGAVLTKRRHPAAIDGYDLRDLASTEKSEAGNLGGDAAARELLLKKFSETNFLATTYSALASPIVDARERFPKLLGDALEWSIDRAAEAFGLLVRKPDVVLAKEPTE